MRQKRTPNFEVEVTYKEVPDKNERLQKLWDLLISLLDPEEIEPETPRAYARGFLGGRVKKNLFLNEMV